MKTQTEPLWAMLTEANVAQGAEPDGNNLDSPWYVKILLGFSGWLAALFLLCFIAMAFKSIIDSPLACFLIGGLMIGGAFSLLRIPKNEFMEHLALAISLAGQALIVFALFGEADDRFTTWLIVALLQAVLTIVMPNFVHSVFSSCFAAFALALAFAVKGLPYIITSILLFPAAVCWLHEFRYPKYMRKAQAIGYGLVLALIQLKGNMMFGNWMMDEILDHYPIQAGFKPWMGELITGAITLYIVRQILRLNNLSMTSRVSLSALSGTLLLCLVSIKVPGITVGLGIILLAFNCANRLLIGLGIVSLLFFVSSYYYLLQSTLLAKSAALFILGWVLLMIRWAIPRALPAPKEGHHV